MYDREGSFVLFCLVRRGSLFVFKLDFFFLCLRVCRGLSCVCAQLRDSDTHSTFDLTPAQLATCKCVQVANNFYAVVVTFRRNACRVCRTVLM
ncbi:BnaC05g01840D [Brassica napus]|uniref:(rape) hypothetical protein n=1 Tax=Brassica napus TaxID=3708 RepID=A0A078FYS6_BRANA|nr:unnamed protein product [Brassica napus]CDY18161.1 BnaC05g01840D [Brassica napus]